MLQLQHFARIQLSPREERHASGVARELRREHGRAAINQLRARVRADLTAYGTLTLSLGASGRAALAKRLRSYLTVGDLLLPMPAGGFVEDLVQLANAPKGGITIAGRYFQGGRFVPSAIAAQATEAQQQALAGKPKADDDAEIDTDAALRWHLMAAMIDVAAEFKQRGDDAQAKAVLDQLHELGTDAGIEELKAALTGAHEAKGQNLALSVEGPQWLAWTQKGTTKRGTKRWFNKETKQYRYQESEPGARGRRDEDRAAARKHLDRIRNYDDVTEEHLGELADKLASYSVEQLRQVRAWMGARQVGGGAMKESLVEAIKQHARKMVGQTAARATENEAKAAAVAAAEPVEAKGAAAPGARPAKPAAGKVYNVSPKNLKVDPERFQFKLNTDKSGVTAELKSVDQWNPDFAGTLSVWRDPATGEDNVVNGHHRHELATRLGVGDLAVRYIDAGNAKEARARGALINIAEGRGTSIDAAKFMRDMGVSAADLAKEGVSLKGAVAADASQLVKLSDGLFGRVASGRLEPAVALAVTKFLEEPALQDALFRDVIDPAEHNGREFAPKVIEEMARTYAAAPKQTVEKDGGLFGSYEEVESLFVPLSELKANVRGDLGREMRDYLAVANQKRAERVAGAGNVLNVEENKRIAEDAERSLATFDQLANSKGRVSDTLNRGAEAWYNAKTKPEKERVRKETLAAIRDAVLAESNAPVVGGSTEAGSPAVPDADAGGEGARPEGLPGAGSAAPAPAPDAQVAGRDDAGDAGLTGAADAPADNRPRDLFGNPVKQPIPAVPSSQLEAFPEDPNLGSAASSRWMDAAKDFARESGRTIDKTETSGDANRVRIGGVWHTVKHDGKDWKIEPVAEATPATAVPAAAAGDFGLPKPLGEHTKDEFFKALGERVGKLDPAALEAAGFPAGSIRVGPNGKPQRYLGSKKGVQQWMTVDNATDTTGELQRLLEATGMPPQQQLVGSFKDTKTDWDAENADTGIPTLKDYVAGADEDMVGHRRQGHREMVEDALRTGQHVPPEVLADYPDLSAAPAPAPESAAPVAQPNASPGEPPAAPAPATPPAAPAKIDIRTENERRADEAMAQPDDSPRGKLAAEAAKAKPRPDIHGSIAAAAQAALNPRSGVISIPALVDELRKRHPDLSEPEVHRELVELRKAGDIVLQANATPSADPKLVDRSLIAPSARGGDGTYSWIEIPAASKLRNMPAPAAKIDTPASSPPPADGSPEPQAMSKADFAKKYGSKSEKFDAANDIVLNEPGSTVAQLVHGNETQIGEPKEFHSVTYANGKTDKFVLKKWEGRDGRIRYTAHAVNKQGKPYDQVSAGLQVEMQPNGVPKLLTVASSERGTGLGKALVKQLQAEHGDWDISYPMSQQGANLVHRMKTESAIANGKPVPPEVLADYPDLAPQAAPAPAATPAADAPDLSKSTKFALVKMADELGVPNAKAMARADIVAAIQQAREARGR